MTSRLTPTFRRALGRLSRRDHDAARRAYRQFLRDPNHPSLRFKKLGGHGDLWSVRASISLRAVGSRDGDEIIWVWIGSHNDFDTMF